MHDDGERRRKPKIWRDHDWYVMSRMNEQIERVLAANLKAGQRVVDFGCGDRPYEPLIRARGAEYIACDLDGNVDVKIEPGKPLAIPDASVDAVVSFQVLEHVHDLDLYIGDCLRILKPGGWLLLSTHGIWLYHPHPTDYWRWTRDGLVDELESRGFNVEEIASVAGPLAWTTLFRLMGITHALRSVPLLGKVAIPPITAFMNARMAVEDRITPPSIKDTNACVYVTVSRKP